MMQRAAAHCKTRLMVPRAMMGMIAQIQEMNNQQSMHRTTSGQRMRAHVQVMTISHVHRTRTQMIVTRQRFRVNSTRCLGPSNSISNVQMVSTRRRTLCSPAKRRRPSRWQLRSSRMTRIYWMTIHDRLANLIHQKRKRMIARWAEMMAH